MQLTVTKKCEWSLKKIAKYKQIKKNKEIHNFVI